LALDGRSHFKRRGLFRGAVANSYEEIALSS
jgi:hypothetical protein